MRIAPLVSSFCSTLLLLCAPALFGAMLIAGSHDQEIRRFGAVTVMPSGAAALPNWTVTANNEVVGLDSSTLKITTSGALSINPSPLYEANNPWHPANADHEIGITTRFAECPTCSGGTYGSVRSHGSALDDFHPIIRLAIDHHTGDATIPMVFYTEPYRSAGCILLDGLFHPPSECAGW